MTFFIVIGVIVVVALLLGYRYDHRQRIKGSGSQRVTARSLRTEAREKNSRWGAGGAG